MALVRTPRTSWIDAGLHALADGGPGAVRIEWLANALGVSKGGFYWHFGGRNALLGELLDEWERAMIDEAIERVERAGGDAREKLRRLFELTASAETRTFLRVDLAVREWSRRDPAVAQRLRRVDERRMRYMRPLFAAFCRDAADVEARCLLVLCVFAGNPLVAARHGARRRRAVLQVALERLLA